MSSKHFVTVNNKLWLKAKLKANLKPELGEKFSGIIVSKDVLLDIKLLRYKLPCCYRGLGHYWNKICQNVHLKFAKLSFKILI